MNLSAPFMLGSSLGLLCITLASCSGDSDSHSGPEGSASLDEAEQLYGAVFRANCKQVYTCCSERERSPRPLYGATEEECLSLHAPWATAVRIYADGLAAGRLVIHLDALRACLAALEPASCTATDDQIDCDRYPIWEPRVQPGGACEWSEECIDGYCDRDPEAEGAVGTCIAAAANGAICQDDRECVGGNCELDYPDRYCTDLYAVGDPCWFDLECASGNCFCADAAADAIDCLGATGACALPTNNGCSHD